MNPKSNLAEIWPAPKPIRGLNPRFTFATYMMPGGIRFRLRLEASRYKKHTPLVVLGEKGSGKTHLVQAIAHDEANVNSELKIAYYNVFSSNEKALRRARYSDILVIDNIDCADAISVALVRERMFQGKRTIVTAQNKSSLEGQGLSELLRPRMVLELSKNDLRLERQIRASVQKRQAI